MHITYCYESTSFDCIYRYICILQLNRVVEPYNLTFAFPLLQRAQSLPDIPQSP